MNEDHEDLVAELRKLLEELLIPELRAIARQMDEIHEQMVLSEKRMNARTDAIWAELTRSKVSQAESQDEKQSIH